MKNIKLLKSFIFGISSFVFLFEAFDYLLSEVIPFDNLYSVVKGKEDFILFLNWLVPTLAGGYIAFKIGNLATSFLVGSIGIITILKISNLTISPLWLVLLLTGIAATIPGIINIVIAKLSENNL